MVFIHLWYFRILFSTAGKKDGMPEELRQNIVKEQFELPERGVRIALLAGLTVIEGSDKALGVLRDLRVTFTVDSLADYETHLRSTGATILQGPSATPAGTNMIVRDVEGVLIEFVEAHHEEPSPKR